MESVDNILNWLVDFLTGHTHQTHYGDCVSQIKSITASIIQGSAIGPTSYVVTASDLHAICNGNELCKYADDTYLIISAVNVNTRCNEANELQHITDWATSNNLSLNLSKSEEIVFVDKRKKHKINTPDTLDGLKRVQHIKILGVTFTNSLSVTPFSTFGHLQCPDFVCPKKFCVHTAYTEWQYRRFSVL